MFRIFKNKVFKILGKNVKNGGTLLKIDFKDDPDYIYGELESALMTADPRALPLSNLDNFLPRCII